MAGKKDIVEQALKLIMGVGEEAAPKLSQANLEDFIKTHFPDVSPNYSASNTDKYGPSSSIYYYIPSENGNKTIRLSDHDLGAREGVDLRYGEDLDTAKYKILKNFNVLSDEDLLKMFPKQIENEKINQLNSWQQMFDEHVNWVNNTKKKSERQTLIDEYLKTHPKPTFNFGGSVREGYQTKGRVVGDVVDQALKLVTGAAEESAPRIKLRSHDNRPDWDKIMRDIDSQTNPHPFSDRERVFNNRSTFEIRPFENSLHLGDIRALQPNQGAGTELLDFLKGIADKHGVPITGTAKAYHSGPGYIADTDKLADWYRRRGFEIGDGYPEDGYDIIYNPRKQKFSGGRIAKGPGGIIDDVVSMAGKLVAGEGEQAAKTGIRAYQGSPHDFAAERLVRFPDGRTEYLVGQPDVLPDVPQGAEVLQDFPLGRMRMEKIGTGEGAQAYGHGLYAAENEGVAKGYRDTLAGGPLGKDIYDELLKITGNHNLAADTSIINAIKKGGDIRQNLIDVSNRKARSPNNFDRETANIYSNLAKDEKFINAVGGKKYGHMYEVNIAADPNTFLDWNREVANQSPEVSKILKKLAAEDAAKYGEGGGLDYYIGDPESYSGESFYRYLGSQLTPTEASAMLREAGIPGIKYLDAGSRGKGVAQVQVMYKGKPHGNPIPVHAWNQIDQLTKDYKAKGYDVEVQDLGTRNYVVFDDKLISIIRKYGIAGASAMLGYNLMENLDSDQAQAASAADKEYRASQGPEYTGGMLPPDMEPSGELTSRIPSASERIYDYVRSSLGGDEETKGQRAETIMNILDQTPLAAGPIAYDVGRGISEIAGYAEGGSVKDEDSWLDAAMTVARNAADKATFGTSKYAAAGADYLTDAALDALGYENDADFDRALAEQEYAMKEGEEKNPAAAGAGDIIGYVAPYLAIGPAEGALTTLGYLSDYGGKVGKTGSLFARALGFADGGEVPEQGYLESVGTAINQAANPVRRLIGVRTVDLPEGVDEVDYEELMNLTADVLDKSMLGFGGADPYAKRPKKFPVSPTGKIVDRVLPEEDDIDGALRIAKDVGGGLTPEEVGRRAAQDPATFDAIMQKYAIPDRDIAEYEALKSTVAKQPQDIQQMTHVGAPPMRDVKVDMPLFGGEYNIGSAPYNVAQGMSGAAQTAYDFKTAPLYMTPMTAPIGAGLDVAEGVATGDPLQASMAALGAPGKMAKGAIIGLSNYAMDPAEAQAGRERFFSKLLRTAEELPMEKMTGQQALAMLRKGTSPEELRWTGTEDFLANTPQVTKQNLIDYINKNRVQLNEIRLGGSGKPTSLEDIDIMDIPAEIRDRHPEIYRLSNKVEGLRDELVKLRSMPDQSGLDYYDNFRAVSLEFSASQAELARAKDAMRKEYAESIGGLDQPVKFGPGSSYGESLTTPGGKNYSENLFALPKRDIYTPFVDQMRKDVWNENYKEAIEGGFTEERARAFADKFNNLNANQLAKFLGKEDELDSVFQAQKSYGPQYTGGHWSDVSPDVLFHTRTSELTYEPPGANRPYRVHNVEETQSDPGQAGRKRGFKDQKAMAEVARLRQNTQELREKLKSEQARIHAEHQERMAPYVEARTNYERELRDKYKRGEISLGDMNRLAEAYPSPESELTGKFRSDTDQIVKPLRDQIVANENEIARIGKNIGDIPAMPYVTSTEKWTDFAIKKELDRAFDNGSDYFSWTPGEAQAERFDLSRHISKIEYSPDDGSLLAYDPNGRMVVNEGIGDPSELDEYVGKELADKIRAEEKSRDYSIGDAYEVYKDEETGEWTISLYGEQSYDDYGDPLVFDSKGEAKDYLRQMKADEYRRNPISLSGLDLKVGGEGMRGYYDKLYLKRVQNVLKESTGIKPEIEVIEVNTPDGPRKQLGVRLTDEMREKARFSDFNKGGRVTGGNSYGNDQSIANALALTREY